jgi:hypothetical protein
MAATETSISNPTNPFLNIRQQVGSITNVLAGRWVRDWTHRGWLEVFRTHRGAKRGTSNPWLTEPTSMFGFYTIHRAIHIVVLWDIFVDVFGQHFLGQKIARLLILLYIRLLITFIAFFLWIFFSLSRLVNEKSPVKSLKFRFIG